MTAISYIKDRGYAKAARTGYANPYGVYFAGRTPSSLLARPRHGMFIGIWCKGPTEQTYKQHRREKNRSSISSGARGLTFSNDHRHALARFTDKYRAAGAVTRHTIATLWNSARLLIQCGANEELFKPTTWLVGINSSSIGWHRPCSMSGCSPTVAL